MPPARNPEPAVSASAADCGNGRHAGFPVNEKFATSRSCCNPGQARGCGIFFPTHCHLQSPLVRSLGFGGQGVDLRGVMADYNETEAALPECVQVRAAVGHQSNGCAAVKCCASSVHIVEMRAPLDEQHAICGPPNRFVKHRRLSSSRNQRNSVPMIGHPAKPLDSLSTERRVTPHATGPRKRQSVVLHCVVSGCRFPWAHYRCARVEVKRPER